jgi:membrane dipeptidase
MFALTATAALSIALGADSPVPFVSKEAQRIHRSAIVIDGHNDFPWELRTKGNSSFDAVDISKPQPAHHTDIPRLRKGGIGAQFWVAYVPPETAKTNQAARYTFEQIDLIYEMIERYSETFELARTADEIERIHRKGKIASLIGIEGGHSIENSLRLLKIYHRLGVRYLTLTHADSIDWADAATDAPRVHGLSEFGKEVVREMNRLGMMVDISHVSAATMHAALDVSRAPIIASHSSAYTIAPHARNVPDDVLLRITRNGGIVMVNFFSGFIVPESARMMENMFAVTREIRAKNPDPAVARRAVQEWRKANPIPAGTVKNLVDHIDHIVKVAGIDHVGLGSDYDGVSTLPVDLPDVSSYPVITQELLNRGYKAREIRKILGQNLLRVMRAAEKVAREWK